MSKKVRKVAKTRKSAESTPRFEQIGKIVAGRWVPRDIICKKLQIVDNTARCYLGVMSHVPKFRNLQWRQGKIRADGKRVGEYMLPHSPPKKKIVDNSPPKE